VCIYVLLCLQDVIYLQFYIPILPADGHAQYSRENTNRFILSLPAETNIILFIFCTADIGCVGVSESIVFNMANICLCVCVCVSLSLSLSVGFGADGGNLIALRTSAADQNPPMVVELFSNVCVKFYTWYII